MIKIGTKQVNKIVINNKEVLKVIEGNGTSTGILKYQAGSTPTVFTVNFTSLVNIGTTKTSANGLKTNANTWNEISNVTSYNYTVSNINRGISGQPNIPYDTNIQNAKFIRVNQLAFINTANTQRTGCYIQINEYSSGFYFNVYDSRTAGDTSFTLPNNTSDNVYFSPSTPIELDVNSTYSINVYQDNWGSNTYRAARVFFQNYDIAPGDAS